MDNAELDLERCRVTSPLTAVNGVREAKNKKHFLVYKVLVQILLNAAHMGVAMTAELIGVVTVDVMARANTTYEGISNGLVYEEMFFMIGALVLGVLVNEKCPRHREILVAFYTLIGVLAYTCIPWARNVQTISVIMAISGLAQGSYYSCANTLIVQLWGDSQISASAVHSFHFSYGVGAAIAPLGARAFFSEPIKTNGDNLVLNNMTTANESAWISSNLSTNDQLMNTLTSVAVHLNTTKENEKWFGSKIEVPYLIYGSVSLTISMLLLMVNLCCPVVLKNTDDAFISSDNDTESLSLSSSSKKSTPLLTVISNTMSAVNWRYASFFLIFFLGVCGIEKIAAKYIYYYAVNQCGQMKFTAHEAASLVSFFWIGFATGRFISIVISRIVSAKYFLPLLILGEITCTILLYTVALSNKTGLWAFTFQMGFFLGPLTAAAVNWLEGRGGLNTATVCFIEVGCGLGGITFQGLGAIPSAQIFFMPHLFSIYVGLLTLAYCSQLVIDRYNDYIEERRRGDIYPTAV